MCDRFVNGAENNKWKRRHTIKNSGNKNIKRIDIIKKLW